MRVSGFLLVITFFLFGFESVYAFHLAPYKDGLFSYPKVLEQNTDGSFLRIDYQELRDINERDAIPVKKVRSEYLSSKYRWFQRDSTLKSTEGRINYVRVGKPTAKTQVIVLYLHGKGTDRHDGVNDLTFGGNFNRIKNLMIRNRGVYVSPDFNGFEDSGRKQIALLIKDLSQRAPNADIIISCGSMGSLLCYSLAEDSYASTVIDGYIILGGARDDNFINSPAGKRNVPVVFVHGSADTVYKWEQQYGLYKSIKASSPDYPTHFILFQTGTHGTPIRMIDWRQTLNWIGQF
ncbi:alpha/beta fold hydrolase [Flexibacterium corallicola]|uniref:alpha/beta hydrolase n=1 Tax=Flexibacterium corallicola TaxID=3037259 RepID=UPI00286F8244|nr:alpha/beta hydrolase [Pseudovibrio sp. M1P-2-3]